MSVKGTGREYDMTFKLDGTLKTTTAQYRIVSMIPGTTGNADLTVQLANDTGTAAEPTAASYYGIGILQSYPSASSEQGTVRLFGVSKAYCAESITAGEIITAYYGTPTTTASGGISAVDSGVSVSVATASIASHIIILGRALEKGSTGTVISVFLNPSLYDNNLIS